MKVAIILCSGFRILNKHIQILFLLFIWLGMFVTFYITKYEWECAMYNFFLVVRNIHIAQLYCLKASSKRGAFTGFLTRWLCMGSTTKSLELAVSFRIFKINCKLIGWVFVLFWGGFCLFVLCFSYWSLTRLCREIPSSVPKIDKRMLSILVYCNVNLYWWKQLFVPLIKTLVSFSHFVAFCITPI